MVQAKASKTLILTLKGAPIFNITPQEKSEVQRVLNLKEELELPKNLLMVSNISTVMAKDINTNTIPYLISTVV